MKAFEKCVCDHSPANPDAMRATLNLIRPHDVCPMDYTWLKAIKTTKEKCKHIFISTWLRINSKIISQDVRCCVHNFSLVLVFMFVCLFFAVCFILGSVYIIQWKRRGHIVFNNNLSSAQQDFNSILGFWNCRTLLNI